MYEVKVDRKAAMTDLKTLRRDQWPFALSLAINRTAQGAVATAQTTLSRDFTIATSRLPFLRRLIKFPRRQWATKKKLSATLGVHEKDSDFGVGSSKDRGFLLGRHEDGGERRRSDDMRPFFIPTDALRKGAFEVPSRSMYPTALRLVESRGTVRTVKVTTGPAGEWGKRKVKRIAVKGVLPAQPKGKQGTFIVDARKRGNPNAWGVFQRYGRGKRDVRMLWAFRSKVTLPKRLGFGPKVGKYVDGNFARHFDDAVKQAMRTAR